MRRLLVVILLYCGATWAAPQLSFSANAGMNLSFYKAEMPSFVSIEERALSPQPLFGASLELQLHDFFRISLGAMYETREGVLRGNADLGWTGIFLGLGQIVDGQYDYSLSYLQIPLQIKLVVPLLIPGEVYGTIGPEIGVNTGQELAVTIDTTDERVPLDLKDSIETVDAGIGFSVGYDLPVGRSANIGFAVGYYLGLMDVCRMSSTNQDVTEEINLYTRSLRFLLVLRAGFGR